MSYYNWSKSVDIHKYNFTILVYQNNWMDYLLSVHLWNNKAVNNNHKTVQSLKFIQSDLKVLLQ